MNRSGEGQRESTVRFDGDPHCQQTTLETGAAAPRASAFVHHGPEYRTVAFERPDSTADAIGDGSHGRSGGD